MSITEPLLLNGEWSTCVYPDQVGWMLHDGLNEKEPMWGLMKVPDFKQCHDDLVLRYHPGPKPLKRDYVNLPIPPPIKDEFRRSEYDQGVHFYTAHYDKCLDIEASKNSEFQKAQDWIYLQMCSSFTKTNLVQIQ